MYELKIKEKVRKLIFKLFRRDSVQYWNIKKKILEIQQNPLHSYKFLAEPLQGFNRVHITSNFVLIFKINHQNRIIEIHHYDHWDNVYKWRPKNDKDNTIDS